MSDDASPQAATTTDSEFTLTIDDALERYSRAGFPRTPRSIQRYCAKGHLECRLLETSFGEKYLITPESVDKHIAYIDEVTPRTGRDVSRHYATAVAGKAKVGLLAEDSATSEDTSRLVAALDARYVGKIEEENSFLRKQVDVKDEQIKDLTERAREGDQSSHSRVATHVITTTRLKDSARGRTISNNDAYATGGTVLQLATALNST